MSSQSNSQPADPTQRAQSYSESTSKAATVSSETSPTRRHSSPRPKNGDVEKIQGRPAVLLRVQTSWSSMRKRCGSVGVGVRRVGTTMYPPNDSTPDRSTVILALLCFMSFIVICALAVRFPNDMMHTLLLCFGAAVFLAVRQAYWDYIAITKIGNLATGSISC